MAKNFSLRNDQILQYIKQHPRCSSQEIRIGLTLDISIATLKRTIQSLVSGGLVKTIGELKSRRYEISQAYELIRFIDVETYFKKEIDERDIQKNYNQSLIKDTLAHLSLFTNDEVKKLDELQEKFMQNSAQLSILEFKNELERLAIDLSWKSSQIEGNTYSLLIDLIKLYFSIQIIRYPFYKNQISTKKQLLKNISI